MNTMEAGGEGLEVMEKPITMVTRPATSPPGQASCSGPS